MIKFFNNHISAFILRSPAAYCSSKFIIERVYEHEFKCHHLEMDIKFFIKGPYFLEHSIFSVFKRIKFIIALGFLYGLQYFDWLTLSPCHFSFHTNYLTHGYLSCVEIFWHLVIIRILFWNSRCMDIKKNYSTLSGAHTIHFKCTGAWFLLVEFRALKVSAQDGACTAALLTPSNVIIHNCVFMKHGLVSEILIPLFCIHENHFLSFSCQL